MLVSRSSDQNVFEGILHRQDTLLHEHLLQQDDNGFSPKTSGGIPGPIINVIARSVYTTM